MEFLTNPWFIAVVAVIILSGIFLVIKPDSNIEKDDSQFFGRLKDAEVKINIFIRKPLNPSDLNGNKSYKKDIVPGQ